MAPAVRKPPKKVNIGTRVKPATHKEFDRLAARHQEKSGTIASRVLEAFAHGNVFCPLCWLEHPILHVHTPEVPHGR